jgi:arginine/ornithine N-succinyltransferase beta subunit
MNKVELFNEVLDNVCKGTELDTDSVKSSNREECVDARYLVIAVLSEKLSDKQIAEVSGWSVQLVNKAKNSFHNRCKCRWGLKEMYKKMTE